MFLTRDKLFIIMAGTICVLACWKRPFTQAPAPVLVREIYVDGILERKEHEIYKATASMFHRSENQELLEPGLSRLNASEEAWIDYRQELKEIEHSLQDAVASRNLAILSIEQRVSVLAFTLEVARDGFDGKIGLGSLIESSSKAIESIENFSELQKSATTESVDVDDDNWFVRKYETEELRHAHLISEISNLLQTVDLEQFRRSEAKWLLYRDLAVDSVTFSLYSRQLYFWTKGLLTNQRNEYLASFQRLVKK